MKVFKKTIAILLVTIVALVAVPLEVQADCVTKTATFKRLAGAGGYSNLPAITKEGWKTTGGTVVIATGEGFHDALSVAGAAGLEKAPILLTNGKKLSPETKAELKRLKPKKVIVAGGEKAITKKCFNEIKSTSGARTVKRIWGQTAPKTAVNLNLEYKNKWKKIAFLATMNGWEDSVSASPVSYALNYPIFLTEKNLSVSKNTINAMKKCGIKEVVILGGTKAIPNSTRDQLKKAGFTVKTRLWGKTAIETSEAVAKWAISKGMTAKNMGVAGITGHREALTGAALCGKNNSVLVLTKNNTAKNTALAKSNKTKIKKGYVFGGVDIVSKKVYDAFAEAIRLTPTASHTWLSATCTQAKKCKVCSTTEGKALGHSYGSWTYLNDTQHQRICVNDKTHIEKTNHTWDSGKETKAATSAEPGEWTYTCTVCKGTKVEPIPVGHSHTFNTTWTTDDNKHWKTSTCGHNIKQSEGNHTWDSGTINQQSTCIKDGITRYTCTVCKRLKEVNTGKTSHNLTYVAAKNPTCTAAGNKAHYTCSHCNQIFTDSAGKNLSSASAVSIKALGHSWKNTQNFDKTYHWSVCTRCNATQNKVKHTFDEYGICTVCGSSVCGHTNYKFLYQKYKFDGVWAYGYSTHCEACRTKGLPCADQAGPWRSGAHIDFHLAMYLNDTKGYGNWDYNDVLKEGNSNRHLTMANDYFWFYPTWKSDYKAEIKKGVWDYYTIDLVTGFYGKMKIKNGFTAEVRIGTKCSECGFEFLYDNPWVRIKADFGSLGYVPTGIGFLPAKDFGTPTGGKYTLNVDPPGVNTSI